MSILQIPPPREPAATAPPPAPRLDGGELYDARRWESAYRELHDVPALIVQMQDDLSRSRRRESLWISLIFHLIVVILVVNSPKFDKYFGRKVLVVSPNDWMRQRELTYLDLPPDAQKLTKRPNTNRISDKDRIATSRTPQLNQKELKEILDSARAGRPGPSAPAAPPQPQSPPAAAQAHSAGQQQQQQPQQPQPEPSQVARLQTPDSVPRPQPTFNTGPLSAGSAIEQAARASLANRGGYEGDGGDMGLGQAHGAKAMGQLDVLSDTMGVDFGPYLQRVLHAVRENWYNLIPEAARAPLLKKGKVSIEFAIMKDGSVQGMALDGSSGDTSLDRAAWGGITASNPFPPLPNEFAGQYLQLRFHFFYNPDAADLR
jgi:TonB family protein